MITSKLTSRGQTTVPQAVRAALQLREGDEITYAIDGDRVVLRRVETPVIDDPFAAFDEWTSDDDHRAYAGL